MAIHTPKRGDGLSHEGGDEEGDISSMRLRTPQLKSAELQTPRFDDFGEIELLPMLETEEASEVRRISRPEVDRTAIQQMLNAFSSDDHATALELAEAILATNPELVVVQSCAKECRIELAGAHLRRIGGPEGVLLVAGTASELDAAGITHREGFLLAQIDGVIRNEDLLDICGMNEAEALRILAKLIGLGILCRA